MYDWFFYFFLFNWLNIYKKSILATDPNRFMFFAIQSNDISAHHRKSPNIIRIIIIVLFWRLTHTLIHLFILILRNQPSDSLGSNPRPLFCHYLLAFIGLALTVIIVMTYLLIFQFWDIVDYTNSYIVFFSLVSIILDIVEIFLEIVGIIRKLKMMIFQGRFKGNLRGSLLYTSFLKLFLCIQHKPPILWKVSLLRMNEMVVCSILRVHHFINLFFWIVSLYYGWSNI